MSRSSRNSREERRRRGNWKHDAGPWADVDTCGGVGRTTVVDVDGAAPAGLIGQDATEFEHLDIGHSSRHVPPCELLLTFLSSLLILLTFPFSLVFCIKIVHENQRAVIFRFGRLRSLRACRPGLFLVQPCLDTYKRVDVRTRTIEIPYHEVVTADMITVGVDAVCYCRVENATRWLTCVRNPELAVQLMAQTHLKALLARSTFSRLLAERQAISQQLQFTTAATPSTGFREAHMCQFTTAATPSTGFREAHMCQFTTAATPSTGFREAHMCQFTTGATPSTGFREAHMCQFTTGATPSTGFREAHMCQFTTAATPSTGFREAHMCQFTTGATKHGIPGGPYVPVHDWSHTKHGIPGGPYVPVHDWSHTKHGIPGGPYVPVHDWSHTKHGIPGGPYVPVYDWSHTKHGIPGGPYVPVHDWNHTEHGYPGGPSLPVHDWSHTVDRDSGRPFSVSSRLEPHRAQDSRRPFRGHEFALFVPSGTLLVCKVP
uniref:uncharacterized protein isoform X1 n=2 Tax=Myxine glutinosa TaxID=7769 RepID=UPI00358F9C5D